MQNPIALSKYSPKFEKYDKRYGDHDEREAEKRYCDVDMDQVFFHFLCKQIAEIKQIEEKIHLKNEFSIP